MNESISISKATIISSWFFWKKLVPANGYGLFFPDRTPGHRLVFGNGTVVNRREMWRHIQLGQFLVRICRDKDSDMIFSTAEGLKVDVNAEFLITNYLSDVNIELLLEKSTSLCAPQCDPNGGNDVSFGFFVAMARELCLSRIKTGIKQSNYSDLIREPAYRIDLESNIVGAIKKSLGETCGLVLLDGQVMISPKEPDGTYATPEIVRLWRGNLYARKQQEQQEDRKDKELEQEKELFLDRLKANRENEKSDLQLAAKHKESSAQEELLAIKKTMDNRVEAAAIEDKQRMRWTPKFGPVVKLCDYGGFGLGRHPKHDPTK